MEETNNIIKVDWKDTIMDIIWKTSRINNTEVFLDFPFWHPVLHNYLSLKILKNKLEHKRITIITNDIISKKIWAPLWINFIIKRDHKISENPSASKERLSTREYYSSLLKEEFQKIKEFIESSMINNIKYESPYNKLKKRGILIIFFTLSLSILLLIFIFYFAVNTTRIYIEPEIEITSKTRNLTFKEMQDWQFTVTENIIKLKPFSSKINISETFKASEIDYNSTSPAKWRIKVINETFEEKTFRPNTRFSTKEWIIFQTKEWETIPSAKRSQDGSIEPWAIYAYIEAKTFDSKWSFIWERWNIEVLEPIFLTIPGLKNDQEKIYWILEDSTFGWSNEFNFQISEEDIKNAQEKIIELLKIKALEKIKEDLNTKNDQNSTKYDIFSISNIVTYSSPEITGLENIKPWDKISEFTLTWSIEANTFIYDKREALNILENQISNRLLEWIQELEFINEKSLKFVNIVSRSEEDSILEVKATTEVEVWINYNFNNVDNSRVKNLKMSILWLDTEEAKNIILNDPKVNNVTIENSPFFIDTVSRVPENITIEIKN